MNQNNKPGIAAIITLGWVQILSWGGSFYLMAVMANPIAAETGWSQQWIYGALSTGILVSGLLSPLAGRIIARTGGRLLLALSGMVMAVGLMIMAYSHSLPLFLFAWVIIGIGMAMGLYDALFATLGACSDHRYHPDIWLLHHAGLAGNGVVNPRIRLAERVADYCGTDGRLRAARLSVCLTR
ncbi:MAG: transporter [Pantoea agglomerans]|nr:transporter [Pantoea agglomerans]